MKRECERELQSREQEHIHFQEALHAPAQPALTCPATLRMSASIANGDGFGQCKYAAFHIIPFVCSRDAFKMANAGFRTGDGNATSTETQAIHHL
jgi:hypothetical protein